MAQMLSGQQMNLEVFLMWTSLRSTLSSFFTHMCIRFSTTTPTETSFCRAAFISGAVRMFEDGFGRFWNLSTGCEWRMFILECDGEFKHIEFTQHGGKKFEKNCACRRRCHFNSTEQLKQEKTKLCMLHVQDNLAGQCEKGFEFAVTAVFWVLTC